MNGNCAPTNYRSVEGAPEDVLIYGITQVKPSIGPRLEAVPGLSNVLHPSLTTPSSLFYSCRSSTLILLCKLGTASREVSRHPSTHFQTSKQSYLHSGSSHSFDEHALWRSLVQVTIFHRFSKPSHLQVLSTQLSSLCILLSLKRSVVPTRTRSIVHGSSLQRRHLLR